MSVGEVKEASGERVYVIGDLHGCCEEPEFLLDHLEESEGLSDSDLVVFLGDYIDRGPDSKSVVDLMLSFKKKYRNSRFLKGNHEDMLLDFLGFGGRLGEAFLYNGGLETIQSYGISVFAPPGEMVDAIPPAHFRFYCELESLLIVDHFIFVHAGLHPGRALNKQLDSDLYWIRDEFINVPHEFEHTVIFGHTPHQDIFAHLPYKIGIDTGLVFGNKLTCLELTEGKVFQITRGSEDVQVGKIDLSEAHEAYQSK